MASSRDDTSISGKFVWYELTTPAAAETRRFFGDVFGWEWRDSQIPGADYALMSAAGTDVAGVMAQQAGMPAGWMGYICVDDVEAAAESALKAGAVAVVPVNPIPGVGRFAILADPTGAPFGLLEYADDFPKPTVPDRGIQGNGWWRELHTGNRDTAFDFYSGQFGWAELDRMPMGPDDFYQIYGDTQPRGALVNDPDAKAPHWLFYFWVDDIDATRSKLEKAGGKMIMGPAEVPGGAWIVHAADPQGIPFAAVGGRIEK